MYLKLTSLLKVFNCVEFSDLRAYCFFPFANKKVGSTFFRLDYFGLHSTTWQRLNCYFICIEVSLFLLEMRRSQKIKIHSELISLSLDYRDHFLTITYQSQIPSLKKLVEIIPIRC